MENRVLSVTVPKEEVKKPMVKSIEISVLKLPGPAALSQMKLEVESLSRDCRDSHFSFDSVQKFHKENEQLTERLLAMEEKTKLLKEALANQNSEFQISRIIP
uniref:Uncharacterized protein n=1 Tax=Solanum lycopersicum TaxID=4081 RepID=A0A3Q7HD23_SOLLC